MVPAAAWSRSQYAYGMGLKNLIAIAVFLTLLLLGGVVYFRIQAGKEAIPLQPASQRRLVEDLEFENADASRFLLSRFKTKPVVVDVWASWCAPCLRNIPQLVQLKKQYGDQIEILGLNIDSDGWPAVERFRRQFPAVNFPLVRVQPEPIIVQTIVTIPSLGPISVLPSAFLIDAEGRLAGKYVGLDQMGQLHADLEELVGKVGESKESGRQGGVK